MLAVFFRLNPALSMPQFYLPDDIRAPFKSGIQQVTAVIFLD
ncbi:Uncharacterised protein [Citrobacter youngae]|nr:Uncharacterised protein [Citrobacter youngae]